MSCDRAGASLHAWLQKGKRPDHPFCGTAVPTFRDRRSAMGLMPARRRASAFLAVEARPLTLHPAWLVDSVSNDLRAAPAPRCRRLARAQRSSHADLTACSRPRFDGWRDRRSPGFVLRPPPPRTVSIALPHARCAARRVRPTRDDGAAPPPTVDVVRPISREVTGDEYTARLEAVGRSRSGR